MSEYSGTDNLELMAEAVTYNRFLLSLIGQQATAGMRILDIGAGIGTFARALFEAGLDVCCFEPDGRQAEGIRRQGVTVVESLDELEDASFDFIYAFNVLEHIEDDRAALADWYRLLRPGGRLLVYVPAFQVLWTGMDHKVGHFRRYTARDLRRLTASLGGQLLLVRYADVLGVLATLVYRVINNGSGDLHLGSLVFYDRFAFPVSRALDRITSRFLGKNVFVVIGKRV